MNERLLRKARVAIATSVAFAACPGDDIALFAAALGPAIPGSSAEIHEGVPHEAVLTKGKIEMKLPPVRVFKLPRK